MERIIKAIEEKLKAQETEIYVLRVENERLKNEVAQRDSVIAEFEASGTALERRK